MQDNSRYQSKTYTPLTQMANSSYFNNSSKNITPNSNKNDKKYAIQNEEKRSNMLPLQSKVDLIPSKNSEQTKQNTTINATSGVLKGNVSYDNLLKTESIGKTNFNINEINQKNKEIMTMEARLQQLPGINAAQRQPPATIVNNYTGNQTPSGGGGVHRTDPLAGLKNTMRSLPSWRTEMG